MSQFGKTIIKIIKITIIKCQTKYVHKHNRKLCGYKF